MQTGLANSVHTTAQITLAAKTAVRNAQLAKPAAAPAQSTPQSFSSPLQLNAYGVGNDAYQKQQQNQLVQAQINAKTADKFKAAMQQKKDTWKAVPYGAASDKTQEKKPEDRKASPSQLKSTSLFLGVSPEALKGVNDEQHDNHEEAA